MDLSKIPNELKVKFSDLVMSIEILNAQLQEVKKQINDILLKKE